MANVLVIPDLHAPAITDGFLEWIRTVRRKHKCNRVICIGDVLDNHMLSFHQKVPECPSAVEELEQAKKQLKPWAKTFKEVQVCIGNHDERIVRLGKDSGIPKVYFKDYADVVDIPGWTWGMSWEIDGVYYTHGHGCGSGICPAFNLAKARCQPVVLGHTHSVAGISSTMGPSGKLIWGMNVGTASDQSHPCMAYSSKHTKRDILACGVVKDGLPILEFYPTT